MGRMIIIVAAVSVLMAVGGCRSARVQREVMVSEAVSLDSAALTVTVADVARFIDRDLKVHSLQVVRSAGGDTVVTLTEITDRTRGNELRRDSVAAAATTVRVVDRASSVSERRSGYSRWSWWSWLAIGLVIGVAVTFAMRKLSVKLFKS